MREGDSYLLSGSKLWISSSQEADIFFVFANVDPAAGYRGITCFVVEKAWGVQVGKRERKVSLESRVPVSHAPRMQGFSVADGPSHAGSNRAV